MPTLIKFRLLFPILLMFMSLTKISYAQDNMYQTILNDAEIFFVDAASFYTYQLRMNESDWITTAGIGFGTFLMIQNDDHLRYKIANNPAQYKNTFWDITQKYGVVQYAELAGVATYALGLFSNNNKIRTLGRMTVQSLTYSGLTAMVIRMIGGRKRPPYTDDPTNFIGFTTDNAYQSFPSGHVTVAFALSTVFAEYLDSPWSRIAFYGVASLTATERIVNTEHWFTDVAIGALLGIASGLHVINEEYSRNDNKNSRLSIIPTGNGISLQYRLN